MERKIKFSVIIPVYNIEKYIKKCINSILEQSYKNFEIIVVDDGSTDESNLLINSINDNRIRIIKKNNGGLSSARNEGIKYVTGDYIWFVDGDDYIEPDALNKLNIKILEENPEVLCFYYYKEYEGKKIINADKIDWKNIIQYPLINTSACAKVFKTSYYIENKFLFPDGKIYEDLALIPFVLAKAKKVSLIDEPLYDYVYRKSSIMNANNKFNPNRDDKFFAIDYLYNNFIKYKIFDKYREELEYLAIKHLLITYSTEILPYNRKIYYERCIRVLKKLDSINRNWKNNQYLKKSAITSRVYVKFFKLRQFWLCKFLLKFKK
ncbi:putative uncharacterized protein [Clostridium sp. CAG:1219]|nr:putative uncharacterized protein [Clostridium sp. CAG:1219]